MTPTKQFDKLIGKNIDITRDEIDQLEPAYTIRVVKRDGEPTVVTRDVQIFRINVEVENGVISKIVGLG